MGAMKQPPQRILFVCGKNRWRSPTAEHIFSGCADIECTSAGVSNDADTPLSPEHIAWADIIFVMEKEHKSKLSTRFKLHLAGKRIICLNIADKYHYMDPALVKLLHTKVRPHLPELQRHGLD